MKYAKKDFKRIFSMLLMVPVILNVFNTGMILLVGR